MKLSLEQIKSITQGVVDCVEVDGHIHFHRLPHDLFHLYSDKPHLKPIANCTAGIRLRFRSDTTQIHLGMTFKAGPRPRYDVELWIDGEQHVYGAKEAAAWDEVIYKGQGTHTFDLWLPHCSKAELQFLEMSHGAWIEPLSPSKIRCLAYGDSITQGLNATLPSQTWLGQVALALDADIHNLGVGGACLDEGLSSIPVPGDFNLITIKYGTNDFCWHLVPQLRENAAKLVEWNRRAFPNAKILLITPMPDFVPGDEEKLDSLGNCREDYRTGLLECAKEIGVPCVYGPDLLNSPDLMSDGVHPSDAGMKQISDRLVPIIQELLAVKG